jgi:hypothetical protein
VTGTNPKPQELGARSVASASDVVSTRRTDAVTSGIAKTQVSVAEETDAQKQFASLKAGRKGPGPHSEGLGESEGASESSPGQGTARISGKKTTTAQVAITLGTETAGAGEDAHAQEGDAGDDAASTLGSLPDRAFRIGRTIRARKGASGVAESDAGKAASASRKARDARQAKRRIQSRKTWSKARLAHEAREAGTGAKAAAGKAARGASAKSIAAAASSAAAPLAGILAAVAFVVLSVLLVSQLVSSLFGFWENEASKQAVEGLPPYITTEMVEAALECQEQYGHPAGCTLAQIIVESGQGDHLSGLATQDNNLFGIKWSPSFASCPEVAGKHSWSTNEEYGGQTVSIMAGFTRFNSVRDCIVFRSRVLLQNQRYAGNPLIQQAIAQHDSDKMAEGLKDAGYATSSSYVDSLKSVMDAYGLRRFDGMSLEDFKNGTANGNAIVAAAESQLGVPYVWGGSTPGKALDCSGLVQYCYAQAGISLPHYSEDQANGGTKIPLSQARPGDILWKPGHVAIYVGGNEYIHEPHTWDVCRRATGISYFTCAVRY